MQTIFDKAYAANEKEVLDRAYSLEREFGNFGNNTETKARIIISSWRHRCSDNYYQWKTALTQLESSIFKEIEKEGLEIKYQEILTEYETIKNKFSCVQCGGSLTLEKIFFTASYITCPYCQTQNTFQPSAQAGLLEHLSRPLAEQRCAHLQEAYAIMEQHARELFDRRHQLESKKNRLREKDKAKEKQEIEKELLATEQQLQLANEQKPLLYETYIKAVFAEINTIIPDLKEQNDKFCTRLLEDYKVNMKYDPTRLHH